MARAQVRWNGGRLLFRVKTGARVGAQRAARIVISEAQRLIRDTPKSGKIYGFHQASAPGEPPASRTGNLLNSFQIQVTETATMVTVSVGNTARYANFLEFGTRKMAARPFMRPAYANKKSEIIAAIYDEIQKAVK